MPTAEEYAALVAHVDAFEQRSTQRIVVLERDAANAALERAALRRLAERNETTLHQVLKAIKELIASHEVVSEQAKAALTIVQNALVLRPSEPDLKPYKPTE